MHKFHGLANEKNRWHFEKSINDLYNHYIWSLDQEDSLSAYVSYKYIYIYTYNTSF